jgi:isochorismate pyruvate lyase
MKKPEECKDIDEIRNSIDLLDAEIIRLLGERFKYVHEIVKYKSKDRDSIVAKERREQVIQTRRELAVESGLNPDIIEQIYKLLIDHFIDEELEMIKE